MTKQAPTVHLSRGLRFRKLDLHIHSPASTDFDDMDVTAEAIVQEALKKGLNGVAVTDHNSGALVDTLKAAAANSNLTIFPGVEITCTGGKEGIHIIALFDPGCSRTHIEGLLSELGLKPEQYGDINAVVNKNPLQVIDVINQRRGLAVLAHANSTRGVLSDMWGQQRTNIVQYRSLYAAEGTDFQNDEKRGKRKRVVDLLDGTDQEFHRKLAVYQASDNPSKVSGKHGLVGIGTRCAYFKLDQVDIDGLRQCFSDPDVRIRQDFEYRTFTYPRIQSMSIEGGFLDGCKAEFHNGLNSILGAKGAGKSLLVEFMRFGLDQPPTNEDIQADHDSKLIARLEDYGIVEIMVLDETGKELRFRRTYDPSGNNPYEGFVREDIAQLFPVLFLSQNEIIRIAEDEDQQIGFIDQFFDFRSYQAEIAHLERQLEALDADLGESLRASRQMKELEKGLRIRKNDLKKLDLELKNPVFDEFAALEFKDHSLRDQKGYLQSALDRLGQAEKHLLAPPIPEVDDKLREDPAVRRAAKRSREARETIETMIATTQEAVRRLLSDGDADYLRWATSYAAGKKKYEEAIKKSGGDYRVLAQKRARTVKEIEKLEDRLRQVKDAANKMRDIGQNRKGLLREIRSAYENYSRERRERCARIQVESAGRLKVQIHEGSNVEEFKRRLGELKRGSYLKDSEIDKICENVDPGNFMRGIIQFSLSANPAHLVDISKMAGIEQARMQTLAAFLVNEYQYEALLRLEYKALPTDRPEIRYNIGGGKYELLENLSVGQKCTAMLIISLTEGTMPIVIDQPEDSLDLRTIWEDICQKVRSGKEGRQFIFTTHNSSVAVASDTDKFIIVEGGADSGEIVFCGSMDHKPISAEALRYLEGGTQTYRTKYRKYRGEEIVD